MNAVLLGRGKQSMTNNTESEFQRWCHQPKQKMNAQVRSHQAPLFRRTAIHVHNHIPPETSVRLDVFLNVKIHNGHVQNPHWENRYDVAATVNRIQLNTDTLLSTSKATHLLFIRLTCRT